MRSFIYLASTLVLATTCGGCKDGPLGAHRWGGSPYGQGSVERQRSRAVTFDPYPLNDIGPEVVGGRPRGFMDPLAQPVRNELTARPQNPWAAYPTY